MVPETTVPRLPLYLRSLLRLADSHETTVSSERLAGLAGVNAATVRKDLSYLGAEGTRGVGYDVAHLVAMTGHQLRVSQETAIVIVGAGHLARALANYQGFTGEGFRVIGLFDVARSKVGRRFAGMVVRHVAELEQSVGTARGAVGVITTPVSGAQDAADRLVAAGVEAILNFAPTSLRVPEHVWLRDVDVSIELQILAYHQIAGDGRAPSRLPTAPRWPRVAEERALVGQDPLPLSH